MLGHLSRRCMYSRLNFVTKLYYVFQIMKQQLILMRETCMKIKSNNQVQSHQLLRNTNKTVVCTYILSPFVLQGNQYDPCRTLLCSICIFLTLSLSLIWLGGFKVLITYSPTIR